MPSECAITALSAGADLHRYASFYSRNIVILNSYQ